MVVKEFVLPGTRTRVKICDDAYAGKTKEEQEEQLKLITQRCYECLVGSSSDEGNTDETSDKAV